MAREWRIEREGDDEHRVEDRWLVTYADMITVLLIFFIVLYSLSAKISAKNFEKLAKSLNNSIAIKSKTPKINDPIITPDIDPTQDLTEQTSVVKRALAPFQGKSQVKVDLNDKGLVISLADTSFFDLGSTELKPEGKAALLKIASVIATESNGISVEGHTDSVKAAGNSNSNWVIAATRAANVAQFLSEAGKVPAKRFQVVSYAEYRPLFPNDTPEHRAMNRRVDIVVQEGPPKPAMTPKPFSSTDTLPPVFGDPNNGLPTNTFKNPNDTGGAIPNPFGNSF